MTRSPIELSWTAKKINSRNFEYKEQELKYNINIKYELNIKINKNKTFLLRSDQLGRARPLEQSPHCSSNAHIFRWTNKFIEKNELKSKLANIKKTNKKSASADFFI